MHIITCFFVRMGDATGHATLRLPLCFLGPRLARMCLPPKASLIAPPRASRPSASPAGYYQAVVVLVMMKQASKKMVMLMPHPHTTVQPGNETLTTTGRVSGGEILCRCLE